MAILWVLFHHMIFVLPNIAVFHASIIRLGGIGFLGVDVFFVISGFLITGLLIDDLDDKIRVKRFYIRRFFKIVPHYLFIIFIGVAAACVLSPQDLTSRLSLLSHLGFFNNYVRPLGPLEHLWSIAVEEHFYLAYPLLLSLVCFLSPVPAQRRNILFVAFVILILLGNYLRYRALQGATPPFYLPVLWQMSHVRFDVLIWGCLLKLIEPSLRNLPSRWKEGCAVVCFWLGGAIFLSFYFRYDCLVWWYYTASSTATVLLMVSALLGFSPLIRFMENARLRWVGKNSYGIYLWHYIIIKCSILWHILWHNVVTIFPPLQQRPLIAAVLSMIFYGSLSLYLGAMTTHTIEQYFLNLRKRIAP